MFEESVPERVEVDAADPVAPVRIFHERELLVEVDQPVDQALGALEMDVIVARAVDEEELALEAFGHPKRRSLFVSLNLFATRSGR